MKTNQLKFKVGDTVRVKEDLIIGNRYSMNNGRKDVFVPAMKEHIGKTYKIVEAYDYGYILDGVDNVYDWVFVDDMLEEAPKNILPIGTKVVPHTKTIGAPNCFYWEKQKEDVGYLYINGYNHKLNCYIVASDLNQDLGNYYNREDFALYKEPKEMTWNDLIEEVYNHCKNEPTYDVPTDDKFTIFGQTLMSDEVVQIFDELRLLIKIRDINKN